MNIFLLEDMFDSLLLMLSGMFLMMRVVALFVHVWRCVVWFHIWRMFSSL